LPDSVSRTVGFRIVLAEVDTGEPPNPDPEHLVSIPAGSFDRGNSFGAFDSTACEDDREFPVHTVYISAFWMDKYQVTKALWDEVYAWAVAHSYSLDNEGSGKAADHPVVEINWYDAAKWCNARSQKAGLTPCYYTDAELTVVYTSGQTAPFAKWDARGYRLPTEAEWEKAARGGLIGKRFPWGDTISHNEANYQSYWRSGEGQPIDVFDLNPTPGYHPAFNDGVEPYTAPVGSFAPNGYGLYDMAGNVWEWVWDWHDANYYGSSPPNDPRGPASGEFRVRRNGGWDGYACSCRVSGRNNASPHAGGVPGFRVVLAPGQP
jgi:formylglycine-generating enzyme required for sulfatase activity